MSLLDLQERIKRGIEEAVPDAVWITAEIGELNEHRNGHCYLDLVDYSQGQKTVAAKARGTIWGNTYRLLKPYFISVAGVPLSAGMNVLLKVQVSFSGIYGLSLNVLDIDPAFTVGELELKRQKAIQMLQEQGCMEMNPSLELAMLPRRLAIVSSQTAAGYRDFMEHLHKNEYGFAFVTELFPALMQGDEAPASIISALDAIALRESDFDAVVVIRGGGAAMDLLCFDDYELAFHIAQFPLPVITGIGHDHDYHIADMVAHTWLKTPTAVADFFVGLFKEQQDYIMHLFQRISLTLAQKISLERQRLQNLSNLLERGVADKVLAERQKLDILKLRLESADSAKLLERGFAIASVNGKRVRLENLEKGVEMELQLHGGRVRFVVGEILEKETE